MWISVGKAVGMPISARILMSSAAILGRCGISPFKVGVCPCLSSLPPIYFESERTAEADRWPSCTSRVVSCPPWSVTSLLLLRRREMSVQVPAAAAPSVFVDTASAEWKTANLSGNKRPRTHDLEVRSSNAFASPSSVLLPHPAMP